ncbi:MAG: hypothetical protein IJ681_02275 [Bacteroidales bacterium]|nr:hypothetical protein [Bacteroidales bacterium]
MRAYFTGLIILSFCFVTELQARNTSVIGNVTKMSYDSLSVNTDSELQSSDNSILIAHSPKKATLLSTFLPGAGQIYNKQAWKVPVIYVAAAGVTYFAVTNGKNKEKFKKEYYNRINGSTDLLKDYENYTNDGIYNLYNAYKSNFQLSIIVGVAFYAVQILDAYVYGHLFNFDLTDDLTMNIVPYCTPTLSFANSPSVGLSFNLHF